MAAPRKTIAEWRESKGVSREALAAVCGVSVPTIYNWERKPEIIRIDYCYKIAELLGVDLSQIIFTE